MFDLDEVRSCTRVYFDAVGDRYLELFRDELEQKPYDQAILARFAETREPCEFEFSVRRIYFIAEKRTP